MLDRKDHITMEALRDKRGPFTYRFGPYVLDVWRRRLRLGEQVKLLPQKPFQALLLLLQAHGEVVERKEFFERLWPDEAVEDGTLTQHIFTLRSILGDHGGDNTYVVTVHGRGYRLATPVDTKAGLVMKPLCEGCDAALNGGDEAYICSFECTFCARCSESLGGICPRCGGEQVRRPRRVQSAL